MINKSKFSNLSTVASSRAMSKSIYCFASDLAEASFYAVLGDKIRIVWIISP